MRRLASLGIAVGMACITCSSTEESSPGGTGGAGGNAGGAGYALPQFVRGAATLNPALFPSPKVVIRGALAPASATLDGTELPLAAEGDHWLATVDAAVLADGEHALAVSGPDGETTATLVVAPGSVAHTRYGDVGAASYSHVIHDAARDQLLVSWIDTRSEKHAYLAKLDGAGRRLADATDLLLDANPTDTVRLATALGGDASEGLVGALYHAPKDFGGNPGMKLDLRVVDLEGAERVAPIELNPDGPSILGTQTAVAWDGSGFCAVWADFELPAVVKKLYFLRVDPATGDTVGPVAVVDGAYDGSNDDEGKLPDLQALSLACNPDTCVLAYRRQVYNAFVALSAPKVFLARISPPNATVSSDTAIYTSTWDIQEDATVTAGDAGDFVVSFAGTDVQAVVNEPDPCDASGRQKVYHVRLDANGEVFTPALHVVNDEPGQRYQAASAIHPEGAAVLWEDEREKCDDLVNGQNRLAIAFVRDDAPEGGYLAVPGSRLVLESWITATAVGPNYTFAWTDERAGGSVLEARGEVFLDSYWRP